MVELRVRRWGLVGSWEARRRSCGVVHGCFFPLRWVVLVVEEGRGEEGGGKKRERERIVRRKGRRNDILLLLQEETKLVQKRKRTQEIVPIHPGFDS